MSFLIALPKFGWVGESSCKSAVNISLSFKDKETFTCGKKNC